MPLLRALLVHKDGDSHRTALYRVLGVTDGDTVDISEDFGNVTRAVALQLSSELADFPLTVSIADSILTINGTGLSDDAVNILVSGGAA